MNKVLKFWIVVFAVLLTPPAAFVAYLAWRSHQLEQARLAQPKCEIRVFMHKGKEVVETVGGALIRAEDRGGWRCENGKAYMTYPHMPRLSISNSINNHPMDEAIYLDGISVLSEESMSDNNLDFVKTYTSEWIWSPSFSHKKYPLDLLPNHGLFVKDAVFITGIKPSNIYTSDSAVVSAPLFWGVRGTSHPVWKHPFVFTCSVESRRSVGSESVNVEGLLVAPIINNGYLGTCSGVVFDSKTGRVRTKVLLYPRQVPYIDGIARAVSEYLSTIIVEE